MMASLGKAVTSCRPLHVVQCRENERSRMTSHSFSSSVFTPFTFTAGRANDSVFGRGLRTRTFVLPLRQRCVLITVFLCLQVALLDIDEKQGQDTAKELKAKYGQDTCHFFKCDVTDDAEFEGYPEFSAIRVPVLYHSCQVAASFLYRNCTGRIFNSLGFIK